MSFGHRLRGDDRCQRCTGVRSTTVRWWVPPVVASGASTGHRTLSTAPPHLAQHDRHRRAADRVDRVGDCERRQQRDGRDDSQSAAPSAQGSAGHRAGESRRDAVKAFAYVNPTSEKDAVAALKIDGVAMPIGGGQDILARMKDYVTQPDRIVNIKNALDTTIVAMPGGGLEDRRGGEDRRPDGARPGQAAVSGDHSRPPASSARRRSATRARSAATSINGRAAGTSATKSSSATRRAARAASP